MAAGAGVEVDGVTQLVRNFVRASKDMDTALLTETERAALNVASRTASTVPVQSGKLRSTIKTSKSKKGSGAGIQNARGAATVRMGTASTPYARWIEYGGGRGRPYIAGGRYLVPALHAEEEAIYAGANRTVDRVASRYSA